MKNKASGTFILLAANLVMIAMIVVHDADHVRQAKYFCYTISAGLWLVNISVYVPSGIALALLWRLPRYAAAATIFNGLFVAIAFAEVHLWRPTFPVWGLWNKNFFLLKVDPYSWIILAVTVLVGVSVALAGAFALGMQASDRRRARQGLS